LADYSVDQKTLLQRLSSVWERNRALTAKRPPIQRRYFDFAPVFATLGAPDRGRQLMSEFADLMSRTQYEARPIRIREEETVAHVLIEAGQPDEALSRIRDACSLFASVVASCDHMAFLEVGRAHDRAGRVDSAIAAYRRFANLKATRALGPPGMFDFATPKIPVVWRRLGELYESKGDRRSAIEAYERFLDFWRNADPELQPMVRQVRERSDRLRRATG
jgi:tetratricopeptide (TPR) repeat protein